MAFDYREWLRANDGAFNETGFAGQNFNVTTSMQPGSASANERIRRGLPMSATPPARIKRRRRFLQKSRK